MNDMINLDNLIGSDDINVNDLEKIRAEIENKIEELHTEIKRLNKRLEELLRKGTKVENKYEILREIESNRDEIKQKELELSALQQKYNVIENLIYLIRKIKVWKLMINEFSSEELKFILSNFDLQDISHEELEIELKYGFRDFGDIPTVLDKLLEVLALRLISYNKFDEAYEIAKEINSKYERSSVMDYLITKLLESENYNKIIEYFKDRENMNSRY